MLQQEDNSDQSTEIQDDPNNLGIERTSIKKSFKLILNKLRVLFDDMCEKILQACTLMDNVYDINAQNIDIKLQSRVRQLFFVGLDEEESNFPTSIHSGLDMIQKKLAWILNRLNDNDALFNNTSNQENPQIKQDLQVIPNECQENKHKSDVQDSYCLDPECIYDFRQTICNSCHSYHENHNIVTKQKYIEEQLKNFRSLDTDLRVQSWLHHDVYKEPVNESPFYKFSVRYKHKDFRLISPTTIYKGEFSFAAGCLLTPGIDMQSEVQKFGFIWNYSPIHSDIRIGVCSLKDFKKRFCVYDENMIQIVNEKEGNQLPSTFYFEFTHDTPVYCYVFPKALKIKFVNGKTQATFETSISAIQGQLYPFLGVTKRGTYVEIIQPKDIPDLAV